MNCNLERLIDQAHEKANSRDERPRDYLGCSAAGYRCERRLWLTYRWAVRESFPGRTLRMFRRGHAEENFVIADLQAIGCKVKDRQREVILAPGIKGHIDGIVTGVPGCEKEKFLLEIKTLSRDRFRVAETRGVGSGLHDHWVQVQLYLFGLRLQKALYFATCKDDGRIYTEIICADTSFATRTVDRLSRLIADSRIPSPISTDPTWWECKGCPAYGFCHQSHTPAEKNCRTCAFAHRDPLTAQWECHVEAERPAVLSTGKQWQGCDRHKFHLDFQQVR